MSVEQKPLSAATLAMDKITSDGPPAMSNETIVSDEAKLTAFGPDGGHRYVRFTVLKTRGWWYGTTGKSGGTVVLRQAQNARSGRGGYTWYKIKSTYSGNYLCLFPLYDLEVAACSQTAFWEEATSWAAVPVNVKAGTFYLKTLTDRTYYLSTDGIWDEYTGVTLTPSASNVITVTDATQDTDIYDIKYDLSAAQKFDLPPYVALNVLVKNGSGAVQTEVVQHAIKYSELEQRARKGYRDQGHLHLRRSWLCPGIDGNFDDRRRRGVDGGSSTVEESVVDQNVEVPAQTLCHSTVVALQTKIKVPFTFKTKVVYDASESKIFDGKGIFEGVLMHDFNFVVGKTEDL
ncbi:hypothetical protein B0H13DRAFT_1906220 [Mycena leptocephala]|nr:hypothetical protein B0H13DRAFT_1906220 [Mycena leptocephala]